MKLPAFLRAGLRVLLFRPPHGSVQALSAADVLLGVVSALILQGVQSFLINGRPGHLEWAVLPDLLFPVLVLWLASWVVAVLLRQPAIQAALLAALLAARAWVMAAGIVLTWPQWHAPDDSSLDAWVDGAGYLIELWWLLAALVLIARLGRPRRWPLLLSWGALAGPWLLVLVAFPAVDLWQSDAQADDQAPAAETMSEDTFHSQAPLFADTLDALQTERPGVDDLYFLGFAGDAGTPAIRNEVELAERLLAARFDTTGRSLLLVNDAGANPSRPFATRTNLEAAIARFAELMDPDDDILLLFLSSHGTREHSLALSQPALRLDDISPAWLRQTLDKSGIRWRVVVVSACYSGGFAEALRDEHTLVITASDATHPSFGCGVSDHYTWFGQAYFDEQLRHTLSFTDAFQGALKSIVAREHAAGETPSNPQMVLGSAMGPKLAHLQARLAQPGGPGDSVQARMSGVREHASTWISSLRRNLRFFSLRMASSSTSWASP